MSVELPTVKVAMLLKLVDIIAFRARVCPRAAAVHAAAPGAFTSTVPTKSLIITFCALTNPTARHSIKKPNNIFFIFTLPH
jgi:hypothetical protein